MITASTALASMPAGGDAAHADELTATAAAPQMAAAAPARTVRRDNAIMVFHPFTPPHRSLRRKRGGPRGNVHHRPVPVWRNFARQRTAAIQSVGRYFMT